MNAGCHLNSLEEVNMMIKGSKPSSSLSPSPVRTVWGGEDLRSDCSSGQPWSALVHPGPPWSALVLYQSVDTADLKLMCSKQLAKADSLKVEICQMRIALF